MGQSPETDQRIRPLAPWRVRVWQDPDGTWSARYRRVRLRSTESWGVHDAQSPKDARRALARFVREDTSVNYPPERSTE